MINVLSQRIITAVILAPIFIFLIFFLSPVWFSVFTAVVMLAATWEWTNLIQLRTLAARFGYLFLMLALLFLSLFIPLMTLFVLTFAWWVLALILVVNYPSGGHWWRKGHFWRGFMGCVVLVPCWVALNYIRSQDDGIYILLFLFILIWGADTAAYVVGKRFGRHKLAPLVSPGKSIEGLVGALIGAVVIAFAAQMLAQIPSGLWLWGVGLSIVTVMFSVEGDLFESMLKREAGLKDSGKLLPGHGGLLDRIDSLTSAAPIFTLGAIILGTMFD